MDKLRDHQEQEHQIATNRKVSIHDVYIQSNFPNCCPKEFCLGEKITTR